MLLSALGGAVIFGAIFYFGRRTHSTADGHPGLAPWPFLLIDFIFFAAFGISGIYCLYFRYIRFDADRPLNHLQAAAMGFSQGAMISICLAELFRLV